MYTWFWCGHEERIQWWDFSGDKLDVTKYEFLFCVKCENILFNFKFNLKICNAVLSY